MKVMHNIQHQLVALTIKINPWIGVIASLVLIIPSLYILLDNIAILRKEHFILSIGILLFIKSLKTIFDKMLDISEDIE
jgi:hypothetical protein